MLDVAVRTQTLGTESVVTSLEELVRATSDPALQTITVAQHLSDVPEIHLSSNKILRGRPDRVSVLKFVPAVHGVCLSSENVLARLVLLTSPDRFVIWNEECVSNLGTLTFRSIRTVGRVRLLACGAVRGGRVEIEGLDIVAADARSDNDRPHEHGVDVLQGAFTLWNMQSDSNVTITANLVGLSAGRFGSPVLGGGIFVSGAGEAGGQLSV